MEIENNEDIINKLCENKEEIKVATEIIRKLSADEKAYQEYLAREKYLHDELSKKAYAEHKMKIVTERAEKVEQAQKAAEQAAEQAILKTRREDIIENLSEFGEIPISIINTVNKEISVDLLKKWIKISAKVDSIDEFISKM